MSQFQEMMAELMGDDGQTAERHEAHDADVEEPRNAPLQVHAKRHDRADQPHVQDQQRRVPALHEAGAEDQHCDEGKQTEGAQGHTAFPLKRPVGRNSSTITRITRGIISKGVGSTR